MKAALLIHDPVGDLTAEQATLVWCGCVIEAAAAWQVTYEAVQAGSYKNISTAVALYVWQALVGDRPAADVLDATGFTLSDAKLARMAVGLVLLRDDALRAVVHRIITEQHREWTARLERKEAAA